ncbi:hypothetical protein CUMW_181440 [Citrus unshiu]|uniref:Uncharacterized protein n=1 Tax=Citrus unshiu TaxID=55188 RepID=A0A2H5PZE8_CITUN|nr:hypothetical protein CUMW_181440 [Citrus unshiu]
MPLTLSINIKLMNRPKLKPIQCFQINGSDLYSRISSLEDFNIKVQPRNKKQDQTLTQRSLQEDEN